MCTANLTTLKMAFLHMQHHIQNCSNGIGSDYNTMARHDVLKETVTTMMIWKMKYRNNKLCASV